MERVITTSGGWGVDDDLEAGFVDALARLEGLDLSVLTQVTLLDRVDTKFVMNAARLPALLETLAQTHGAVESQFGRSAVYFTRYFDTPQRRCYVQHHNGQRPRYKVRWRRYLERSEAWFEVKVKRPDGSTLKLRSPDDALEGMALDAGAVALVDEFTDLEPAALRPVVESRFRRATLIHRSARERVTIDVDLLTRDPTGRDERFYGPLTIVEVKRPRGARFTGALDSLRQHGVRPTSMSKFAVGMIRGDGALRYNALKPLALQLQRVAGQPWPDVAATLRWRPPTPRLQAPELGTTMGASVR